MNVQEFKLTLVFSTAADLAAFSANLAGGSVQVAAPTTAAAPKKGGSKAKGPVAEPTVMPSLGGGLQQNAPTPFPDLNAAPSMASQSAPQAAQTFQGHGQQAMAQVDRGAILANVSQVLDQLEKIGVPEANVGQLMTNAFARINKPLGRVGMLNDQELAGFMPGFMEYASAYLQASQPAPARGGFM